MKRYRVDYTAVTADDLPEDASRRLDRALRGLPGPASCDGASAVVERNELSASFGIDVRLGMADAARDGSRLAKEALRAAGLGAAQLVRLSVALEDEPQPSDEPTSLLGASRRSSVDGAGYSAP